MPDQFCGLSKMQNFVIKSLTKVMLLTEMINFVQGVWACQPYINFVCRNHGIQTLFSRVSLLAVLVFMNPFRNPFFNLFFYEIINVMLQCSHKLCYQVLYFGLVAPSEVL